MGRFEISQDLRALYFREEQGLMKVSLDSDSSPVGEPQTFAHDVRSYAVAEDGGYCVVASGAVLLHAQNGGRPRTVLEADGANPRQEIAVSPDGRWMLYTQTTQSSADLVLLESVDPQ